MHIHTCLHTYTYSRVGLGFFTSMLGYYVKLTSPVAGDSCHWHRMWPMHPPYLPPSFWHSVKLMRTRSLVFPFLPLWSHLPWLRFIRISLLKALKVYLSLRGLAPSWQARLAIVWGPGLLSTGERICRTFASLLQEPGAWGRQGTVSEDDGREWEERAVPSPILLVFQLQALWLLQVDFQGSPKHTPGTQTTWGEESLGKQVEELRDWKEERSRLARSKWEGHTSGLGTVC